MSTIEEIQQGIAALSPVLRQHIASWLQEFEFREYCVAEAALTYDLDAGDVPARGLAALVAAGEHPLLTFDEYVKLETHSSIKHEFIAGQLFAMSGPTLVHNRIAGNLFAAIHAHVRGGQCAVFVSDARVRLSINGADIGYYPDVMVACEQLTAEAYWLDSPRLVVEVLSPSTEAIDRREKLLNYRAAHALEEYVLISQRAPELAIHRRCEQWTPRVARSLEAVAEFRSIGLSLSLAQIYESIGFAATATDL